MKVVFHKITKEEVDVLQKIAIQTFRESYAHLNTEENFLWYIKKAFSKETLTRELQNKESFWFFIQNDSFTIGYLKLNIGSAQTELHSEQYLEVERIYLDKKYQGKGYGSQMIQFAISKAKRLNKTKIWLGVWDQNPQAIDFYNRAGFEESGSHIFKFGTEDQIDIIMEMHLENR